jgi:hypothetical protein
VIRRAAAILVVLGTFGPARCLAQAGAAVSQEGLATFGTTVVAPFGFCGRIYAIPPGTYALPRFAGLRPLGTIYTTRLDVKPRSFHEGFPGVTDRFEWFAIDYTARIWVESPGSYSFVLESDDGAALHVDERLVIDNDGEHLPTKAHGDIRISGGIHDIRVSYYQGPRYYVALVLHVKPPKQKWRVFDTDDFKPPSNPADWKYANPRDLEIPADPCKASERPVKLQRRTEP